MSKKDEALKLALVALEEIHPGNMTPMAEGNWNKAITAIREVLADSALDRMAENARELGLDYGPAQQQEPVFSFQMQLKPGWGSQYPSPCVIGDPDLNSLFGKVGDIVTFYTSPQRKPWVSLTEEEKQTAIWSEGGFGAGALWAEAKLREKNA